MSKFLHDNHNDDKAITILRVFSKNSRAKKSTQDSLRKHHSAIQSTLFYRMGLSYKQMAFFLENVEQLSTTTMKSTRDSLSGYFSSMQ